MARKHRVPVAYVNQFGGNDDLVFDGRSCAFDADGAPIARGRSFDADVVICDLDATRRRSRRPTDVDVESEIWRALVLGTRDYVRKCGFSQRRARPVGRHRLGADRRDRRRGARAPTRARRADAVALLEPRQRRRFARSWRATSASQTLTLPIEPTRCSAMERTLARRVRGHGARRHRGEHPGAHPRQPADGALEQARRAAADDRQQVRAGGRLLHAVRRHVRRARA